LVVRRIDLYWRRFHDSGTWRTEFSGSVIRSQLSGWSVVDAALCRNLTGYLYQMMVLLGWQDIGLTHPACRVRGSRICEFRAEVRQLKETTIDVDCDEIDDDDLHQIAQELVQPTDLENLSTIICDFVQNYAGCRYVALWVVIGDQMHKLDTRGSRAPEADLSRLVPETDGRVVGRLEFCLGERTSIRLPTNCLERLAPLIGVAVDKAVKCKALVEASTRGNTTNSIERRLDVAQQLWRITARHRDVLPLLARGAANKEIAERLECQVGTIELHVSELLRRSGTDGRVPLIAAFWQL
jgi:DNA-binding CsgD family transcriptional regulator